MVIQRWQSVLLLIAAAMMAVFSFCSLGQFQTPDFSFNFITLGVQYEGQADPGMPTGYLVHTWGFFALSILCIILPLIAIFMFKNMRLQKQLCVCSILFIIADCVTGAVLGYTLIPGAAISWSSIIIAPFLAIICATYAYRRICKDHKLLQSIDRIR